MPDVFSSRHRGLLVGTVLALSALTITSCLTYHSFQELAKRPVPDRSVSAADLVAAAAPVTITIAAILVLIIFKSKIAGLSLGFQSHVAARYPALYALGKTLWWIPPILITVFSLAACRIGVERALDAMLGFRSPFDAKNDEHLTGYSVTISEILAFMGWVVVPALAGASAGAALSSHVENLFTEPPGGWKGRSLGTLEEEGTDPERLFALQFFSLHQPFDWRAERHWARECGRWMENEEVRKVSSAQDRMYLAERLAAGVLARGVSMSRCTGCHRRA
ncbi:MULTISPECIES: hypothetical protein [unclassified Streptomyces]|uniref:hypothetical protein n=1 Tax=unclassified Streptomyces TaxID=2593676 RepID=UPI003D7071F9